MITKKKEIDMTKGSVLKNILSFSIPMMLSGFLQIFYNIADTAVSGRWIGSHALSAVGATGTVHGLTISLFLGLSVGASVIVSRCYGSKDDDALKRATHTSIALSIISGIIILCVGQIICRPLLQFMGTPPEIIDNSVLYMRIVFVGIPASMVYNFGSSILRGIGNTKLSLYVGTISGAVNLVLNLVFVIVFHMGIAGVAAATAVSGWLSAIMIMCYLVSLKDVPYKINIKELKVYKQEAKSILSIGLPAGFQSSLSSLSIGFVQFAINSFGADVIAGRSAASSIESIISIAPSALSMACLSAVGQNYGAKNEKRILRYVYTSIVSVIVLGAILGGLGCIFAKPFLNMIIVDSPKAVEMGIIYVKYAAAPAFICYIMDILIGVMQGIGHAKKSMVCSLLGICGGRFLWVFAVLPLHRTVDVLFLSWPVCRMVVIIMHLILLKFLWKKSMQRMMVQ